MHTASTHLELDVLLRDGQHLPECNLDLLPDEVNARHHLRDRVLDLDARVHLHKVKALLLPQELDGTHAHVVDALGGLHCGIAHGLADLWRVGWLSLQVAFITSGFHCKWLSSGWH